MEREVSEVPKKEPAHAYNVVSETCRACNGICGGKLCQICLLWAMLTDSYSRWRTTGDMFNETGESCDL